MKISQLTANKSLASLGDETVKVTLTLENGAAGSCLVPAGLSAGKYEAPIVSADQAVSQINQSRGSLLNKDFDQTALDKQLEHLKLAANASLAVSAAFWKATERIDQLAQSTRRTFPKLLLLLFEGGKHGNPKITFQEFLLVETSLKEAITDFHLLKSYLEKECDECTTVGVEGGFSPADYDNDKVLQTIKTVFLQKPLALDCAGSFTNLDQENYGHLLSANNIISIEDPFSDEQWERWTNFNAQFGHKIMVVGDDLTVTNPERIQKAIDLKAINAVIIKPNQNGTITGTLKAVEVARNAGLKIIVSHRGEETTDDWIVDFALKVNADYVKFGGMDRGERIAKYNRLLELGMT